MSRKDRRRKTPAPTTRVQPKVVGLIGRALDQDYHDRRVRAFRTGAMKVMRDIRNGVVEEEHLDMLNNFIQLSLALMSISDPGSIDRAMKHAEILDLGQADNPDLDIIWDPKKLETYSETPTPEETPVVQDQA